VELIQCLASILPLKTTSVPGEHIFPVGLGAPLSKPANN